MTHYRLALLLCCLPLLGMGWFGGRNPLDSKSVVSFEKRDCNKWCDNCSHWVAEWITGSLGWQPIPFSSKLIDGDGIAFEAGLNIPMRACCVCNEGVECYPERVCDYPDEAPLYKPPPHIYNLTTGKLYPQGQVDNWNAGHEGE